MEQEQGRKHNKFDEVEIFDVAAMKKEREDRKADWNQLFEFMADKERVHRQTRTWARSRYEILYREEELLKRKEERMKKAESCAPHTIINKAESSAPDVIIKAESCAPDTIDKAESCRKKQRTESDAGSSMDGDAALALVKLIVESISSGTVVGEGDAPTNNGTVVGDASINNCTVVEDASINNGPPPPSNESPSSEFEYEHCDKSDESPDSGATIPWNPDTE
jgi:hypothetical protein